MPTNTTTIAHDFTIHQLLEKSGIWVAEYCESRFGGRRFFLRRVDDGFTFDTFDAGNLYAYFFFSREDIIAALESMPAVPDGVRW